MPTRRIAVTGGPGAGKTTLWQTFAGKGDARIVPVCEVATLMLGSVFTEVRSAAERRAVQCAIFHVQQNLEAFWAARAGVDQVLLCDRGTPDGAGYWPEGHAAFFAAMNTDWDAELARYDAVVFLQTAAARGLSLGENNATRTEDLQTALAIDARLHQIWSRHPRFHHVPSESEFSTKLTRAEEALSACLEVV